MHIMHKVIALIISPMKLYFFTGIYKDCKMERYQLLGYERNVYEISLHFTQANEKISGNCLVSLTALMFNICFALDISFLDAVCFLNGTDCFI